MVNKKSLLSILILSTVVVMVGAATWATFEDSKSSTDQVTAGTLALGGTGVSPVTVDKVAPGDSGTETQTVTIDGNLDGLLKVGIESLDYPSATNTTAPEPHTSLIGDSFKVKIQLTDDAGTPIKYLAGSETDYVPLDELQSSIDTTAQTVTSGSTYKIVTTWQVDSTADNGIQGQSISFNEKYTLNSREGIDKSGQV